MINVMIADDNLSWITSCSQVITKEKEISLCSIATNGEDAFKSYLLNKPDVLLLDLDMPLLSGSDIINKLTILPDEKEKKNVLIISGHFEDQLKFKNLSKVYNIISKPIDHSKLINCILEVADFNNRKELDINRIKNLFIQIKLNIFSKGATYLLEIIKYCYYDENLIDNMKHLYTMVSCKYTVSSKSVQWSIENSLKLLSKNVDVNILNSIFLYNDLNSRISPKQFIELVLEYINRNNL